MTSATRTGVARRLFSVLEAFEDSSSPLRLNEIARRCGLSSATTLRMVRELVDWGALDRLEDGSYRVGMRMWAIGSHAPCVQRIQRETTWHLRGLAAVSSRTVVLGAAVGGAVVIVDRALGPRRDRTAVEIGDRFPLHATAVGKVFLAAGDPPAAVTERYTRYTLDTAALSAPLARTVTPASRGNARNTDTDATALPSGFVDRRGGCPRRSGSSERLYPRSNNGSGCYRRRWAR